MSGTPDAERFKNLLAFALVGAFIACIPLFVYKTIPDANKDIITYMVGQLSGMALTALGFYFVNKAGQDALEQVRAENTGKAMDAITAAANATPTADVAVNAANKVADAAAEKADEIAEGKPIV